MPIIRLATIIHAPPDLCFDLARDVNLHMRSTAHTSERVITGRTEGLFESGEQVTWRARHLGIYQNLTVQIGKMDRPHYFEDFMRKGAFKSMRHDHYFEPHPQGTLMRDDFHFQAPLGLIGRIVEKLFLTRYMTTFLTQRNSIIKREAEQLTTLTPKT